MLSDDLVVLARQQLKYRDGATTANFSRWCVDRKANKHDYHITNNLTESIANQPTNQPTHQVASS
jgi:hypothetical protein